MADRFDVVVVGGRCAGAPLATWLARAGLEVCVVDRAPFPSDTPSTHAIQPTGVKALGRLGVRDALLAAGAPLDRGRCAFDDRVVDVDDVLAIAGAPMLSIRRPVLDTHLLDTARAAGADVRTETTVTALVERDGRVAGVETTEGTLHARLVVGADGARSTVARLAGAAEYHRTEPGRLFLWGYFDDAPAEAGRVWLGKIGNTGFLASPTDGGAFLAAVVIDASEVDAVRADRQRAFDAGLEGWPGLADVVRGGRQDGAIRMMARWHGFFRRSAGPGWALVGDAGHFKDPTPGQGISDALRQAETMAWAITGASGDERALDRALRRWWAWRDRDAWAMYWFAHALGAPGFDPPVLAAIQRRIADEPDLTAGLVGVLARDVAPGTIFTPGVAAAAAVAAVRSGRASAAAVAAEMRGLVGDEVRRGLARAALPARRLWMTVAD